MEIHVGFSSMCILHVLDLYLHQLGGCKTAFDMICISGCDDFIVNKVALNQNVMEAFYLLKRVLF